MPIHLFTMRCGKWISLCLCPFLWYTVTGLPYHAKNTPYIIKGKTKAPPKWSVVERASPDLVLDVSIGLVQHRFEELERHLLEGQLAFPPAKHTKGIDEPILFARHTHVDRCSI